MKEHIPSSAALTLLLCWATVVQAQPQAHPVPVFEVDPGIPTMPDHTLLGGVGGVAADKHGNVWVFQRPHTLEEGNATENGYVPAPPVSPDSPRSQPSDL